MRRTSSGKSYRVLSHSSLDHDKRVRHKRWLRLSLAINAVLLIAWLFSRKPVTSSRADVGLNGVLKESAQNMSQLNKDLKAAAEVLQAAKNSLASEQRKDHAPTSILEAMAAAAHVDPTTAGLSPSKAWLAIGIPTFPRHNDTDYLTSTLDSLLSELPPEPADPFYDRVHVLVMNNKPGQHPVFSKVQRRIQQGTHDPDDAFAQKALQYVEFIDNPGTVEDPTPEDKPEPNDFDNPTNIPGREVRRQTCDLIELMEIAQPLAHYYLFMEDDFRMCPHTVRLLHYIVAKLNKLPGSRLQRWLGLRVSYGMNGILMRSEDLKSFASYMRTRIEKLPPDLIWPEWFSGHGPHTIANRHRPMAAYRYNLLEHKGTVSSFTVRVDRPAFPRCYEPMADVWSLGKAERFQERKCPNSDLSPCNYPSDVDDWSNIPLAQLKPTHSPSQ